MKRLRLCVWVPETWEMHGYWRPVRITDFWPKRAPTEAQR